MSDCLVHQKPHLEAFTPAQSETAIEQLRAVADDDPLGLNREAAE